MKKIAEFLQAGKVFYLATNGEKTPDVRPMGISLVHNERIYFVAAKPMNLFKQLDADNNISISAHVGDRFLRLYGKAIMDDSTETIEAIFEMNAEVKKMFPAEIVALYYLSDVTASICSFTDDPEVHSF